LGRGRRLNRTGEKADGNVWNAGWASLGMDWILFKCRTSEYFGPNDRVDFSRRSYGMYVNEFHAFFDRIENLSGNSLFFVTAAKSAGCAFAARPRMSP
jgi:hypothetical protein